LSACVTKSAGCNWHHIAAEVARSGIPTIMMLVQNLHGISHNKIEDTKEEHLALAVTAFDKLADKAIRWIESRVCGVTR
jgi:beta-ureidopropionase / N-carbamoyl-L-amino-acid hydrolase